MNQAGGEYLVVRVRDLEERELAEVLRGEQLAFRFYLGPEAFKRIRRSPDSGCRVATRHGLVLGHLVYHLRDRERALEIASIAVFESYRRHGIGAQLLADLKSHAFAAGCREIRAKVRETNLAAQLFFRGCGYRAYGVERAAFKQDPEDAFLFRCSPAEGDRPGETLNRLAALGVDLWSSPPGKPTP